MSIIIVITSVREFSDVSASCYTCRQCSEGLERVGAPKAAVKSDLRQPELVCPRYRRKTLTSFPSPLGSRLWRTRMRQVRQVYLSDEHHDLITSAQYLIQRKH